MKTVGNFLCVGVIIVLGGLAGNNQAGRDQTNQSNRKLDFIKNDRSHNDYKPYTSFKLYPYYNRLNKRHVT